MDEAMQRARELLDAEGSFLCLMEARLRECWIGTGKLMEDGSASNDFRVWMNECNNRAHDLRAIAAALQSAPGPQPNEATEAMIEAGVGALKAELGSSQRPWGYRSDVAAIYRAMESARIASREGGE